MPRRVVIRRRSLNTDVAQIEELVHSQYKEIWSKHKDELELVAGITEAKANAIVPIDTGDLRKSISVRVSKSNKFLGIIAEASSNHRGYDYALIQDKNEAYRHAEGKMAHYLSGVFAREVADYYESITGNPLQLPSNLQHAIDYINSKGG